MTARSIQDTSHTYSDHELVADYDEEEINGDTPTITPVNTFNREKDQY
jgi:hypothetical protein